MLFIVMVKTLFPDKLLSSNFNTYRHNYMLVDNAQLGLKSRIKCQYFLVVIKMLIHNV